MVGLEELAVQVRELAELQVSLAGKMAELEKRIEQTPPVQGEGTQMNAVEEDASRMNEILNSLSALDSRIGALENASHTRGGGDDTKLNEIAVRVTGIESLRGVTQKLENEIDSVKSSIQTLSQQGRSLEEALSTKTVKKLAERRIDDVAAEVKKRNLEAIVVFENENASIRQRSEDAVAVQVKQFQELYATVQRKLDSSIDTFRRQTQDALESFKSTTNTTRAQTDDTFVQLQKEVREAVTKSEEAISAIKQRSDQSFADSIARSEEKVAQKIRHFEESFAETQRKVRDSSASIEDRILSELKRESEKLRAGVLENLIDVRDRLNRVETLEENLENKMDAKLNEASSTFANLFDRSSKILKEEIYGEFANELAESRAAIDKLKNAVALEQEEFDALNAELEKLKHEMAVVMAKKRVDEEDMMRSLEVLEKRLSA
ncbi:MAG: hypothetical protein HY366_02885 [Candidatus Aenigmarchaeota archaeon]|nr:hypothetical protein [Candidatus Aenigmarchaeota archaeon]